MWQTELYNIINILEDMGIYIPILADYLRGLIQSGNIHLVNKSLHKTSGVMYNIKSNSIELDSYVILTAIAKLKVGFGNFSELQKQNSILGGDIGICLAGILYQSIYVYNRFNRGAVIGFDITKRFYGEFIYRSIYGVIGERTTVARRAASVIYQPLMQMILELQEIPFYYGIDSDDKALSKKIKKKLGEMLLEVQTKLEETEIDQPSIDAFTVWFTSFAKDYLFLTQAQKKVLDTSIDQDDIDDANIKTFKIFDLTTAYSKAFPQFNKTLFENRKYPSPLFRELYITAEPLAQIVYNMSLTKPQSLSNLWKKEKLVPKIKSFPEIQQVCAKGLSFLNKT